jgi:hypothetical protein
VSFLREIFSYLSEKKKLKKIKKKIKMEPNANKNLNQGEQEFFYTEWILVCKFII